MRLAHYLWPKPIDLSENRIPTLVIENSSAFAEMILAISAQCRGEEGAYILSENDQTLAMERCAELIIDPFSPDYNQKRFLGRLFKELSAYAVSDKYSETAEALDGLKCYLLDLFESSDHPLTFDTGFTVEKLLKAMDVKIEKESDSFLEQLLEYMSVVCDFGSKEIFFMVNLKCFLGEAELDLFAKEVFLRKYRVLLLENTVREKEFLWEDVYLIDKDLCAVRF